MENLKEKYTVTQKALVSLKEVIEELKKPLDEKRRKITRDSMIQRFEYTVELFWKYLKAYLQEKENVKLEATSPKAIIIESLNAQIITQNESDLIGKALKDRNLTSHMYQEDLADKLVKIVPDYYETLETILKKLTP